MIRVHRGIRSTEEKSGLGNTRLSHVTCTLYGTTLETLRDICTDGRISYCVSQREICPTSGREHLQTYIQFNKSLSFKTIKNLLPNDPHLERPRGTPAENRTYCTKEDTRLAGSESMEIGVIDLERGQNQGKRNDLLAIKRKIDEGKSEAEIAGDDDSFNAWAKYPHLYKRYKTARIPPRDRNKPPDVTVLVGATGVGKTRRVYDAMGDDVYMKDSSKWWDGYNGQKCILLDEFSSQEHFKIEEMLRLLDRYPYQGQTKGGYVNINSPYIYITSNIDLEQHFISITQEQIDALNRRINNKVNL